MAIPQKAHVTVICGPPGSGKTSYVNKHRSFGDLIVDVDALFKALTFENTRDHLAMHLPFVLAARDAVLSRLLEAHRVPRVWIIECGASPARRNQLRDKFSAKVIVLEVAEKECIRRIEQDLERDAKEQFPALVKQWWNEYRPLGDDTRLREA